MSHVLTGSRGRSGGARWGFTGVSEYHIVQYISIYTIYIDIVMDIVYIDYIRYVHIKIGILICMCIAPIE